MDIEDKQRTLRNWIGEGVITGAIAKKIVDDGRVPKSKVRQTLVRYQDLVEWGYI